MEHIVAEGSSPVYRDFIDFRMMAAQMEMMCNHNHGLEQSMQGSEMLSGFMDSNRGDDHDGHNHDKDDEYEIDPKTGKKVKKKKRYGWLRLMIG